MSVSDDVSDELGGGTLQLWRVNDLIYRDEAEVLAELDKHRQGLPCSSAGLSWALKLWLTGALCEGAVTLFGLHFILWNCDCCAQIAGITS